eukprot:TRINITY_DN5282_c0_g3_i1.p1 TRINITY_DN5282_c0_g3~~TRINITY_DN5282_c0_g3_i1.p1  ORF type:complete len:1031 (+),score=238.56 TRINITY_DN5282_c0_g3_i1:262-3354(+)
MADIFTTIMTSMAPLWVELSFLVFFALGFIFLRADRFRHLLAAKPPPKKVAGTSKLQEPEIRFNPKVQKTIDAEAAAGNHKAVLKAWRDVNHQNPTPQDVLRTVVQSFLEVEPHNLVDEVIDHMKTHQTALGNSRMAIAVLDPVARASKVKEMVTLFGVFQKDFLITRSLPMFEVVLGGFATVGDKDRVEETLAQMRAVNLKLSARGYSLLIKGFLKNGLVDVVFQQILSMKKAGFTVPTFAVTQFFRVACEAGRSGETFTMAKDAGLEMPSEAFAAVLEDCARSNNLTLAQTVRQQSKAHGIPLSGSGYDSLLKLYAVAGDKEAADLFSEMQSVNAHISEGLCVGLLARCAESKFLPFAEEIVKFRRRTDGMTIALYSALMKVYAFSHLYSKACDLYSDILEDGLEPDNMMYGCLMKFAVECGRTQLSQDISEKVGCLDIQNYMSLIRAAGRDKDVNRAFAVINKLKESQVTIDVAAYNCVLDVCVQAKDMRRATELLQDMKESSLVDVITYNTLLKGYCHLGDLGGAKRLLAEMTSAGLEPNDVSYNCIINAAVTSGKAQEAWSLIDMMTERGIKIDHYTVSIMMKAFKNPKSNSRDGSKGLDPRVLDLLDRSQLDVCSDEILFNTVLETCIRHKELRRLKDLMDQFEKSSLRPSVPTYGSLIKAMSTLKKVDQCWYYWKEMEEKRGLQPNDIVLGCMLDALVCNGQVDQAVAHFKTWKKKVPINTVLYSILIKGFANARQHGLAMDACHEMREQKMKMNIVVYNSIIDAQARSGRMEEVSKLIGFMHEDGVELDIITHSTIVKGYCIRGDLDRAYQVFKEMRANNMVRDSIVYNILLDGCTRNGNDMELAEEILADMDVMKIKPSNFTLGIMVKMYGRRKQLDKCFAVMEGLPRKGDFAPNQEVYTCLMTACLNNNATDKALEVFATMKQLNWVDFRTYTVLLSGLVRTNQLALAVEVVNEAYSLNNPGARRPKGKVIEPEGLANLLSALAQKGMMNTHGDALVQRLRDADVPIPSAQPMGKSNKWR